MDIWDDNKGAVEWLTRQLDESSGNTVVKENIQSLRRDAVVNQANVILSVRPYSQKALIKHLLIPFLRSNFC